MRKLLMLGVAVCLSLTLVFQGTGQAQKQPVGHIELQNDVVGVEKDGDPAPISILFTLFKDGVVVRSSELITKGFGTYETVWENLPPGPYEMHCEATGFGKLVRKVAVGAGERAPFTLKTLPEKDEVQGAGPTLFEMQRKIALLEIENADLKERLTTLEKAK